MSTQSSQNLLKLFIQLLDQATLSPPPKEAGLSGRKGLARRITLSLIDDIMRLDGGVEGADWSSENVAEIKEKARSALQAMNDAE